MSRPAVAIPEKLFFKIGEVCELAGVQAHVLRYWESEFPMLAPQKNRAGQRVYRKRDVEMAQIGTAAAIALTLSMISLGVGSGIYFMPAGLDSKENIFYAA